MKNYFLFLLLFVALNIKSQATAECYNSGIPSSFDEMITSCDVASLTTEQSSLILMPHAMNEKDVIVMIKEKNNSDLNRLLKKVKLARMFQNVGFSAIPEALIGGGLIGAASVSNKGSIEQKSVGVGLVVLSSVCLTSSLCFKFIRTKNYKKAIAKYNQLYN